MANFRRLEVELVGDDRQLNRTLGRVETRLTRFGRKVDKVGSGRIGGATGAASLLSGFSRGNAAAAGAAALGFGLVKVFNAAKDAQVVMAQTRVSVEQAGLAWEQNAARISKGADEISKAASFDDEAVLQSFQLFVRGTRDVEKSLDMAALAADVARGRYISLEAATMLVQKASMGNAGALRRLGIDARNGASAVELLDMLHRKYAGSAAAYSKTAQGGIDKLKTSLENAAEVAGGPLAEGIGAIATEAAVAVDELTPLIEQLGRLASIKIPPIHIPIVGDFGGVSLSRLGMYLNPATGYPIALSKLLKSGSGNKALRDAVQRAGGFATPDTPMSSGPGGPGGLRAAASKKRSLVTGMPNRLEQNLLDAQLSGNTKAVLGAYRAEAAFLKRTLGQKNLTRKQRTSLKEDLLSVQSAISSITEGMAADAKAAAEDAKSAAAERRRRHRQALEDAARAQKEFADRLRRQAEGLRDAALSALDRTQERRNIGREIRDAKKQLALALKIGSPEAIRDAREQLADAKLDLLRSRVETARITGGAAAGFNVQIGNVTLQGIQNVREFLEALRKLSKGQAPQTRGRHAGATHW